MEQSFETVLGELIDRRYGTDVAFAAVVGLSPERISQLRSGRETSISYKSLEKLWVGFPLVGDQQTLYEAWRTSFARSPMEEQLLVPGANDEAIAGYLAEAGTRMESGQLLEVFQLSGQLWRQLRTVEGRLPLAARAAELRVLSAYALDRRPEGIQLAGRLAQFGQERSEPLVVVTGLWLQALGEANMPGGNLARADASYQRLCDYLAAWQPRSDDERERHYRFQHGLVRDRVLVAWRAAQRRVVGADELLVERVRRLELALAETDSPSLTALGGEVRARGLVQLRAFDEAEDTLAAIRGIEGDGAEMHRFKTDLTTVRWLVAISSLPEAAVAIKPLLDKCEAEGHIHQRNEVARLQAEIFKRECR